MRRRCRYSERWCRPYGTGSVLLSSSRHWRAGLSHSALTGCYADMSSFLISPSQPSFHVPLHGGMGMLMWPGWADEGVRRSTVGWDGRTRASAAP
jgi:hypothetical protein